MHTYATHYKLYYQGQVNCFLGVCCGRMIRSLQVFCSMKTIIASSCNYAPLPLYLTVVHSCPFQKCLINCWLSVCTACAITNIRSPQINYPACYVHRYWPSLPPVSYESSHPVALCLCFSSIQLMWLANCVTEFSGTSQTCCC